MSLPIKTLDAIVELSIAIEFGRVTNSQWQRWAERMLLVSSPNELSWLVDLYEADQPRAALGALANGARRHTSEFTVDVTSLRLGFLYLDWEQGLLSATDLLHKAGDITDSNYDAPSCETVYQVLNRLESAPTCDNNVTTEINNRLHELFAVHGTKARMVLEHLENAT